MIADALPTTEMCLERVRETDDEVYKMIVFRPLMAVAVLALASSGSFAFQEQQASAPAEKSAAVGVVDAPVAAVAESAATKGTAVRIPGLGTLGVIPKMDFGLELLYGVADASNPVKRADPKNADVDDVLIRGSIKHKF
jgi:hypothetical protein